METSMGYLKAPVLNVLNVNFFAHQTPQDHQHQMCHMLKKKNGMVLEYSSKSVL